MQPLFFINYSACPGVWRRKSMDSILSIFTPLVFAFSYSHLDLLVLIRAECTCLFSPLCILSLLRPCRPVDPNTSGVHVPFTSASAASALSAAPPILELLAWPLCFHIPCCTYYSRLIRLIFFIKHSAGPGVWRRKLLCDAPWVT